MPNDDEQKHLEQEDSLDDSNSASSAFSRGDLEAQAAVCGDSDEADQTEEILDQRPPQRSGMAGG